MMGRKFSLWAIFWYFFMCLVSMNCSMAWTSNLHEHVHVTWGNGRCESMNDGKLLKVSLDQKSGSGFESRNEYLFAKIDMQIKLVSGNSAGTVTAYYLSSSSDHHDEIDFQFLGNLSGDPYTVHTNVFCDGQGNREQQFRLPFDPTVDFHTYSIYWTPHHIVFSVDGIPIREFKNLEHFGVPYPKDRAMKVYASLWNADDWATRGGLVKTNWSEAPFNAYFRNYTADHACSWSRGSSSCKTNSLFSSFHNHPWLWDKLDYRAEKDMKEFQRKYMVYDYCADTNRFPQGLPMECYLQNLNS